MGVDWSLREGYAWAEDKEHCEEYGRMLQADPNKVSARAKKRGLPQVTLTLKGQRVHFLYICHCWEKKICLLCVKYTCRFFSQYITKLFMFHSDTKSCQELSDVPKIKQGMMPEKWLGQK